MPVDEAEAVRVPDSEAVGVGLTEAVPVAETDGVGVVLGLPVGLSVEGGGPGPGKISISGVLKNKQKTRYAFMYVCMSIATNSFF